MGGEGWGKSAPYGGKGESKGKGKKGRLEAEESKETYICGLPSTMTEDAVRSIFTPYGTITKIWMVPPKNDGPLACKITFAEDAQAKWLVENMNGNIPEGLSEVIKVAFPLYKKQAW